MTKKNVAFIGTGVMGASIVHHLLQAGYAVHIFTRTASKAQTLIEEGAVWHKTAADATKNAEVVFTMVGDPIDVEEVYFGDAGIFKTAKEGTLVIDLTTSQPTLAKKISTFAAERHIDALDAPVSGGDVGAKNGTLSIMVGGKKEVFERARSIFEVFGQNVVYQGLAGAGQHTKMCNQIAIATNMIGVAESLVYGKRAGLDLDTVLQSISAGAAGSWSLSNLAPRMIKGDLEPGFYIKHFLKDMRIALEEAEQMDLQLPGLQLAKKMYDELAEQGLQEKGTQAIIKYYKS